MTPNKQSPLRRAIGILLVAVPFLFGALRFLTSGNDARYLWTSLAAFLGAAVLLLRLGSRPAPNATRTLAAVVLSFVCAALVAYFLGARSATSITVVAAGFAICCTGGLSLLLPPRP